MAHLVCLLRESVQLEQCPLVSVSSERIDLVRFAPTAAPLSSCVTRSTGTVPVTGAQSVSLALRPLHPQYLQR